MTDVFDVQNITFRYDDLTAVKDLSLKIAANRRIAILGANGSGKSTFLRLLDGLYFADAGAINFRGAALTETALQDEEFAFDFRRRVALVFQNPDVQLFNPTVFDEVAFAPLQLRWSKSEIREKISEILNLMEIAHLKDRPPHRLSGGEKKRVALASVLILEPEVLLMDEPTAALDPRSRGQIIDFLSGWSDSEKTVVTATHDLDVIEEIADYCFVFQNGALAGEGAPKEILADVDLLERTNLIHSHRHRHADGTVHSHAHRHLFHDHKHD